MPSNNPDAIAAENQTWAAVVVEELRRLGIQQICVSPGSRCTTLTLAVAGHRDIRVHRHFDERGAGFLALGLARSTGTPVALICTSGSATANYLPAVVEAAMDHVPLILLTADRPPELQQTGANQTIVQPGMYSHYVRDEYALPCPDPEHSLPDVLTEVDRIVRIAQSHPCGPVHINCPFRKPFWPEASPPLPTHLQSWYKTGKPLTDQLPSAAEITITQCRKVAARLAEAGNGVVVVGALRDQQDVTAARHILQMLPWPAFVDIQSQLRFDDNLSTVIRPHQVLLNPDLATPELSPDLVLWLGGRVTAKHLDEWLRNLDRNIRIQIRPHGPQIGQAAQGALFLEGPLQPLAETLREPDYAAKSAAQLDELQTWERLTAQRVDDLLHGQSAVSGPLLARLISGGIPADKLLFLANSLIIREFDEFSVPRNGPTPRIVCNRGVSGIDGNLATAIGAARGSGRHLVAVLGDLALLHDLNSLALVEGTLSGITLIVVNNNGGGIFERLPIADQSEHFEQYFRAAHGIQSFESAAAQFDIPYNRINELENLTAELTHPRGSRILEVQTDAAADEAGRRQLHQVISR